MAAVALGDAIQDFFDKRGFSPIPAQTSKPRLNSNEPAIPYPSRKIKRTIKRIRKKHNLNWTDVFLLYVLALMERRYGSMRVFPSQTWLAKIVKISRRQVIRIIKKLRKLGLIIIKGVSKFRTLLYSLSIFIFQKQMVRANKQQEKFFSNKNVTHIRSNINLSLIHI